MAIPFVSPENLEYFKTKQDAQNDATFAKKSELQSAINTAIASVLTWKGVKENVSALPSSGNKIGDVWHVSADSGEYAWGGTEWQALGGMLQASVAWDDITGKPSTFAPSTHSHNAATDSASGFMSAADKQKLDGIATGANNYTHPASAAGAKSAGLYKVATDAQGHVTAATEVTKGDITALGIPGQDTNTTYSPATQSQNGLMSSADKTKLDNLEEAVAMTTEEIDAMFQE